MRTTIQLLLVFLLSATLTWASPDGRLVFISLDGAICTANADGNDIAVLTEPDLIFEDPTWSPNGRYIAFLGWEGNQAALYIIDADGSHRKRLTDCVPWGVDWSPDGESLIYTEPVNGVLTLLKLATGERTPLTAGLRPAWSPDGQLIASNAQSGIRLLDRAGQQQALIDFPDGRVNIYEGLQSGFAWSPDGAWLTFSGKNPQGFGLFVARPDGGSLERLAVLELPYLPSPSWSADGQYVFYGYLRENGQNEIHAVDVTTGRIQEILAGTEPDWLDEAAMPVTRRDLQATTWGEMKGD